MARLRMRLNLSVQTPDGVWISANQHGGGGGDGDPPFHPGGPPPPLGGPLFPSFAPEVPFAPPNPPEVPYPPSAIPIVAQGGFSSPISIDGDSDPGILNVYNRGDRRVRRDVRLPNGDISGMRPKRRKKQADREEQTIEQRIADVQSESEKALQMCKNTVEKKKKKKKKRSNKKFLTQLIEYVIQEISLLLIQNNSALIFHFVAIVHRYEALISNWFSVLLNLVAVHRSFMINM